MLHVLFREAKSQKKKKKKADTSTADSVVGIARLITYEHYGATETLQYYRDLWK